MDLRLAFDKAIGNGAERLVRSHHARRLRRLGWGHALDPPDAGLWAAGGQGLAKWGKSAHSFLLGALYLWSQAI